MVHSNMLIWGQANPEAMSSDYNGVYLNLADMHDMVRQIDSSKSAGEKIPVLMEHTGSPVGHVVSAWVHKDTLQCVLELHPNTLESSIGQQFVKDGLIKELSLGYLLDVKHTEKGLSMNKKTLKEISIVKKGARDKCHILGVTESIFGKK